MLAQLKKIGIEPGKSFDIDKLDPAVAKFYNDAFPGDAGTKLWWWPVQSASFLKLRAEYADKFIAA